MAKRTNVVMQVAFFRLSGVLPPDEALGVKPMERKIMTLKTDLN